MARDDLFVGLEIGTSKVCVVVAEARQDGELRLLGVGETPSRGVRKGEIVDFNNAAKCVHDALSDAEEKSDVEIKSVWAAVTGAHIQSFNNRGATTIPEDRQEIEPEDLRDVEVKSKEVNIPTQNSFIHSIIQYYYVDGQEGVLDPTGMLGQKLEADFHIVHGVKTRIQNTIRCIRECNVDVEEVVLNSIASAQVVLDQHQKELGALVVDIGGGTTDFIVYVDGAVRCSGVLGVGGDHITNDISIGLRLPMTRAEKLKIEEGACVLGAAQPGDTITLKNDPGFSGCTIEREMLNTIIHVRVRELFELMRKQIERECSLDLLAAGALLTGGCSRLRGIAEVAEATLGVPAFLSRAQSVAGPTSAFQNPQLSTAIGLVKYGQAVQSEEPRESVLGKLGGFFRRGFRLSS